MKAYRKKNHLLKKLKQAMLLVLVFLLAGEPILVAAQALVPQQKIERSETTIGSIGDIIAIIPGLQAAGRASFVGDAVAAVVKTLFKQADNVFRAVLNGLKLADAFDVVADLVKTVTKIVGGSLGDGLNAVIHTISNIFTGSRSLWGDFVAFVRRVGADMLLKLGFDEGSALVGRILNLGVDLSDEALIPAKNIADDFVEAGVDLSDDAAKGTGELINTTKDESKVRSYLSGAGCLLNATAFIAGGIPKLAIPSVNYFLASSVNCDIAGKFIKNLGLDVSNLSNDTLEQVGKVLHKHHDVFTESLLKDLYKSVDDQFDKQLYTLLKKLMGDPDLAHLINPDPKLVPPAVRDGTINLLRKVSHPRTYAWGKPGLDFQLKRVKKYFYEKNLSAVERYERIDDGKMFLDLVLGDGTPLEIKYWRRTTIASGSSSIVQQISTRLRSHQRVILEFGTTIDDPLIDANDKVIKDLINRFTNEGITATTDISNTSAQVLIQVIPK